MRISEFESVLAFLIEHGAPQPTLDAFKLRFSPSSEQEAKHDKLLLNALRHYVNTEHGQLTASHIVPIALHASNVVTRTWLFRRLVSGSSFLKSGNATDALLSAIERSNALTALDSDDMLKQFNSRHIGYEIDVDAINSD